MEHTIAFYSNEAEKTIKERIDFDVSAFCDQLIEKPLKLLM